MSIKVIGQLLQGLGPGQKPDSARPATSGSEFDHALALARSGPQAKAEEGRLQVEMMRLEMMRGLLDPGLENDSEGWSAPIHFPSFASVYSASGQTSVDPPVKKPEPSQQPIDELIDKAARENGVEPALVRAVVQAESAFNPRAVSPVGAEGLMQLMPETAKDLGVDDSFDPEQNVMGGTRYLGWLLEKYGGDLDKTLAAYNWGPGNVDRRGIDSLPKETRDYLVRVKGYYEEHLG